MEFYKRLTEVEEKVTSSPDSYVFDRYEIEKKAIKNGYQGKIFMKRGRNNKVYVFYDENIKNNKGTKIKIKIK